MKYEIIETNLVNTGGHCMVLFAVVRLPDENRILFTSTSEEISEIYETQDEAYECQPETAISTRWFDDAENTGDRFEEIHKKLFETFDAILQYE